MTIEAHIMVVITVAMLVVVVAVAEVVEEEEVDGNHLMGAVVVAEAAEVEGEGVEAAVEVVEEEDIVEGVKLFNNIHEIENIENPGKYFFLSHTNPCVICLSKFK